MANEARVVQQIIKRYGEVINLKERPEIMIDILRRFRLDEDGGLPPGGAPKPPPPEPSPGPSGFGDRITLDDVMRELLKVSRAVTKIAQQVGPRAAAAPRRR